jgi:hypothetical protein
MKNISKEDFIIWNNKTKSPVDNGSRLGEVAEHKTSLELQMFKLKIKCQ